MCTIHDTFQTKLKIAETGELTFLLPPGVWGRRVNIECYKTGCLHSLACNGGHTRLLSPPILSVPDELLSEILMHAAPLPINEGVDRVFYRQANRLCLVNKRFLRLATPILYSNINLDEIMPPGRRITSLERALTAQPHLGAHVRELHLSFCDWRCEIRDTHWAIIRTIVDVLHNVRRLHIRGHAGHPELIKLVHYLAQRMPHVKDLYVGRFGNIYWSLDEIASILEFHNLKKLGLSGVNGTRRLNGDLVWRNDPGVPDDTKVSSNIILSVRSCNGLGLC